MKNCFFIKGGNKLYGKVNNQTSKNATLPILTASLLINGNINLINIPNIIDVNNMLSILEKMGTKVERNGGNVIINTEQVNNLGIDTKLSKTMRSSIFLLGPYLSRFKNAMVTLPGGCNIGKRPIDVHIDALKALNVKVSCLGEHVFFDAGEAKANKIKLRLPSVGATENIIQFACLLKGKTIILNAAREPEVVDLCNFLNASGAKILGSGTNKITIYGVNKLNATTYKPIGDRIVAGTLVSAVAMCGGDVTITNACPYQNLKFLEKVASMGCKIDVKNDIIHIVSDGNLISAKKISTGYYPKFPTDLQSIFLAMSVKAQGITTIKENVFENRFQIADELIKCGAKIKRINNRTIKVKGTNNIVGNMLKAKELRGGAALVLIGLIAKGITKVENIEFIDRGYESLEKILSLLGVDIRRVWQKKV